MKLIEEWRTAWEVPSSHVAETLPQMPVDKAYRIGIHVQSDEAVRLVAMHGLPIPSGYKFATKP